MIDSSTGGDHGFDLHWHWTDIALVTIPCTLFCLYKLGSQLINSCRPRGPETQLLLPRSAEERKNSPSFFKNKEAVRAIVVEVLQEEKKQGGLAQQNRGS